VGGGAACRCVFFLGMDPFFRSVVKWREVRAGVRISCCLRCLVGGRALGGGGGGSMRGCPDKVAPQKLSSGGVPFGGMVGGALRSGGEGCVV